MLVEFKIPDLGESIESGEVVKLLVKVGDVVKPEQPLLELETGKAVVEVPCDVAGRVAAILIEEGDTIAVNQAVFQIETDAAAAVSAAPPAPLKEKPAPAPKADKFAPTPPPKESKGTPTAPGAKRVARELDVDITAVKGTGAAGRISEDDIRDKVLTRVPEPSPSPTYRPLPDFSRFGPIERKPMTSVRLATAQHMAHAWNTVPQVTQYDFADITDLEQLRKRYAEKVETLGGKLTITPIMLKVVSSALRQFPAFNASVDMLTRTIIHKDYVHIGVAVDTERGLLVPVVRDADQKNIQELAVELARLAEKAHRRQLGPTELEGGTFTITNLGTVGGTHFTPIVNWPEVAILGISRAAIEPLWKNEQFVPRLCLQLSLSYDHRVIDGADGARFLRWICEALEQPFFLALEG
jgi:pyruvate dehydrogenase E2 component (dihydrolipoamide acetyltransferase)